MPIIVNTLSDNPVQPFLYILHFAVKTADMLYTERQYPSYCQNGNAVAMAKRTGSR